MSTDAPDLGAFTTVFRALNTYQPPRAVNDSVTQLDSDESARTPTSSFLLSDYDSEAPVNTTVWAHRNIADYLDETDDNPEPASPTEDGEQPSLGLLGALDFLAAERLKFAAQLPPAGSIAREHSSNATSDDTWIHAVVQPRRKRRRKMNRSNSVQVRRPAAGDGSADATGEVDTTNDEEEGEEDSTDSSDIREPPRYYESTPPSPPVNATRAGREQRKEKEQENRLTMHPSHSTPSLRLTASIPIDPRVLQLRNLAHKLRMLFPKDAASLAAVLSDDQPGSDDFVDPRGPVPHSKDTLVHVFLDHSNILIGFFKYQQRHMRRKPKQMSHAALALILERGRPVTRRVLATSSPLYQPVDVAEHLGYEVHILQRVPDAGDNTDRQYSSSSPDRSQQVQSKRRSAAPPFIRGHSRGVSLGSGNGSVSSTSLKKGTSPVSDSNIPSNANSRTRMREQCVDELLQLKLHQALASTDEVPANATIVLATGDGNVGQFNEEGFLGCVKLALKKGWKVELYSWENGLSKMWKREFGTNKRFEIHMLDRFAVDLLEL
ncbi:hypothetical protein BC835DRAFT_442595 [Cytidiella melzeri]|nr:hypothetical protein BC835DRAFT_442595 [Cytidiella melzeri]